MLNNIWIIEHIESGDVAFETTQQSVANKVNTEKFKVWEYSEWIQELQKRQKSKP